jgi:hypothetical protein
MASSSSSSQVVWVKVLMGGMVNRIEMSSVSLEDGTAYEYLLAKIASSNQTLLLSSTHPPYILPSLLTLKVS